MRHFQLLAAGVDVVPLLHAVQLRADLWNANTVRTAHAQSAHRTVEDIVLRYSEYAEGDDFLDKVCGTIRVINYPAFALLPAAQTIVLGLMAQVSGEHLGRVFISRMAPGTTIPLHTDRIKPAEAAFPDRIPPAIYYERYQIALQAQPGVVFTCGEESVFMAPGQVWWFDNCTEHSVVNNSAEDRISLVVDIRPFRL